MKSLVRSFVGFLFVSIFVGFSPSLSLAQKVNILVVAIHGVEVCENEWTPTIDYLQSSLPQYEFNLIPVVPIDLDHIKDLVEHQSIDFIITQPAIYVDLELNYGVSRILTMVKKGGYSEFGSTLITRSESGIHTIKDLDNKTVAGVAELGFGGWLVGYKEMLDQGFDPYKDSKEVKFLGDQQKEIQAVLDGVVDVAVIRTGVLEKLSASGKINIHDFRVLAPKSYPHFPLKVSTSLYPEWAFAKTHKASNELSKDVATALLALKRNSSIGQKAGFQEWIFPYDYQPVHELLKTLHVDPYKNYGKVSLFGFVQQHKFETILSAVLVFSVFLITVIIYASNRILSKEKAEKEKVFQEMRHMASHDCLTGVPNRKYFREISEQMLQEAKRHQHNLAVLFVDLNGFKKINDSLGHEAGDKALSEIAQRLRACIRNCDSLARIGGDEFVVLLAKVNGKDDASIVARRMLAIMTTPILYKDQSFTLGGSIGISFYPEHGLDVGTLVKNADTAMYDVKTKGENDFAFFANS